jgi:SAM-dependent methyltransferase
MEDKEYQKLYELEENWWFFDGERNLVDLFFKKYYHSKNSLKILDIGCGTGFNSFYFNKYGSVFGIDSSPLAVNFCKQRGLKNILQGKAQNLPYDNDMFDVIICIDVLYHKLVENDVEVMKEFNRVLKPGGRLFITDCAFMCLYSGHDISQHGIRRYTCKELRSKLKSSGFKINKLTYYNMVLFPVAYLLRKIENVVGHSRAKSDVKEINHFLNLVMKKLFNFENSLLKYMNFPFGINIFCVARKNKKVI